MAVFCKNVDLHVPVCVEYIQTTLSLPIAWSCYFNSKPLPLECVCVCGPLSYVYLTFRTLLDHCHEPWMLYLRIFYNKHK